MQISDIVIALLTLMLCIGVSLAAMLFVNLVMDVKFNNITNSIIGIIYIVCCVLMGVYAVALIYQLGILTIKIAY